MDVVYAVAPEHISMFSMAPYSCKNGDTVQTNPVHEKGTKFFPKQCVSAWLSISVGRTSIVVGVFKFLVEDTEVLIARRFVEETLCILEFHEGGMMLPLWSYVTCVWTDAGGIVTAPIIGFNVLAWGPCCGMDTCEGMLVPATDVPSCVFLEACMTPLIIAATCRLLSSSWELNLQYHHNNLNIYKCNNYVAW